jgi:hypothetical protein
MIEIINNLRTTIEKSGYIIDKEMSKKEIYDFMKRWQLIISPFFNAHEKKYLCQGQKAFNQYVAQTHKGLYDVSLLGCAMVPNVSSKVSSWQFGFEISGNPLPPDLREFHMLEFSVTDAMWRWTLVHTHEDFAYGGPYFIPIEEDINPA